MQGISLRYTLIVFTNRREIHWKPTHGGFFTQQSTSSKLLRHQYLSPQLNSKFIVLPPAIHTFNSFSASIFNLNGMVAVYPHVASRWAILCSQFRNLLTDNMHVHHNSSFHHQCARNISPHPPFPQSHTATPFFEFDEKLGSKVIGSHNIYNHAFVKCGCYII